MKAYSIRIRGVVQGVGFRPFVYRVAHELGLRGWVLNAGEGVEIHVEGPAEKLESFRNALEDHPPIAALISGIEVQPQPVTGAGSFVIRDSRPAEQPVTRISPDLPVCDDCLREMREPSDRRYRYPYINCTNCGPRYSIVTGLPYDRDLTTMAEWPMCKACEAEFNNVIDRRFHAQPVACPNCGPDYFLRCDGEDLARGTEAVEFAVQLLLSGGILAVKGIGGYHLACDARDAEAVSLLRMRKFRKEKPFALMVADLAAAESIIECPPETAALLTSAAAPIVLSRARVELPGVAPDNDDLGVMLPYTPLHHLLFDGGAPEVLVMTSANRSAEPIEYRDEEALEQLEGMTDAFLIGERRIARRVEDSIARVSPFGATILRRSRGYAPAAVAELPAKRPILAVGADLKNAIALVVDGQVFVSQHIGDLDQLAAFEAFRETIGDMLEMWKVSGDLLVVHDAHPEYASTLHALEMPGEKLAIQHHRAHIASVLTERSAWEKRVIGFAFDGTGYGDDGSIWGGEVFAGSVAEGFERVTHLRPSLLPGGDAAARFPVQAAAGFLSALSDLPDLEAPPFRFPERYRQAKQLIDSNLRIFPTTSIGRLFDTAAALLGFTREITFEGQAAMWLEHITSKSPSVEPYPFPGMDYAPLLQQIIEDRLKNRPKAEIARAFHAGIAHSVVETGRRLGEQHGTDTLVLSGGVFQNQLLLRKIKSLVSSGTGREMTVWVNHSVPANDGGICLGQAGACVGREG